MLYVWSSVASEPGGNDNVELVPSPQLIDSVQLEAGLGSANEPSSNAFAKPMVLDWALGAVTVIGLATTVVLNESVSKPWFEMVGPEAGPL